MRMTSTMIGARFKRILSFLLLLVCTLFVHAQTEKIYSVTPDGKTYYNRSDEKMIIRFKETVSAEKIIQSLSKFDVLKPISREQILPSPKNVVLAELNKSLTSDDFKTLIQQIEALNDVVYANMFLAFDDGTLHGITDRIAVKLLAASDYTKLESLARKNQLSIQEKYAFDPLVYFIRVPKNTVNALQFANQLAESNQFAWAEIDFLRLMKRFNTNDPFLNRQWSLNNTGNSIQYNGTPSSGTVGADMKVFNAWGISTGSSNIRVAIIDEGVDLNHPDLIANMLPGFDGTGLNSGGAPSGNDAHGTACAGIVAARGNNSIGMAGVAYNCRIVPIRIAYSSGTSWVTTNSWIGTSIDWAWQTGAADILSNSWGGGSSSALINDPITRSVTQGRGGLGAPVLFAAGNSNGAVSYPATLTNVIAVAAMSMCDTRKTTTSCDNETFWGSNFGTNVDIGAPGVKIYTTDISGSAGYATGDYTATFNGTSSACPNAAGVMALILSANPSLNQTQARQIIESTCDKVGGYTYNANVAGQPNGTWCTDIGYGRVNAFAALQMANPQPCITPPPVASVNANPASVCGSGSVGLTLSNLTLGTGQTYQWQSSPNNTTWTNISGQTGFSATVTTSSTTWYRCLVTCGGVTTPSQSAQVVSTISTITSFPHTQNFDASSSLPCGWTSQNANNDARTWNQGSTNPRSAPNNVFYTYSATAAANDWLFSPALNLVAGQSYRVRFWYRARSASFAEKLEVRWGSTATAAGMTSAAIFSNTNIINTSYLEGTTTTITPTISGNYFVGFRVFSDADKWDLYVDDITFETVSSCTEPTVAGTISGASAFVAGTSNTYTYSSGNGNSISWELATGAGAYTSLGVSTNTLSLSLNPGSYALRTRVSKTGCNDEFSNVINLTVSPRQGDNISIPISASLPFSTTGSTSTGSGFSNAYTGTNNQPSPDVFYTFTTGSCADSIAVSTCGSSFDTYIHLLNASGGHIFSNDDNGPYCAGTTASMKRSVLPNTTYFIVVEGYASTTGNFSLSISEIDNPVLNANISASGPTSFCAGGNVTLTASAGNSYNWSNGATTQSITVNASGDYSVTVTDANGCSSTSSAINVTVNTPTQATVSASGPTSFCAGGNVTLTASAGNSYNWSNGATTQSITVNASGDYSVTVTDANGCSSTSSAINVTVNTPAQATVSAGGPTSFCAGGNVTLTASAGNSYNWSNGATTQSITVNASGDYSVTVTDANGCSSTSSAINVTVNTPTQATVSASGPTSFCAGGNVTLTASAGNSYNWSNGATSQSITVNASGDYSVTVTDANGCQSSALTSVTVNALPIVSAGSYGPLTTLSAPIALTGTPSGGTFSGTAVSGNSFDPSVSGVGSFTITYSFIDGNGCSASATSTIEVAEGCNFSVGQIGGPTNACPYQGTTGINATYSIDATGATSFNWAIPSGSTNVSGQGTSTISFKYPSTYTGGTLLVTVNGCSEPITRTLTITRSVPAVPAAISGPTNVCAFRGTGNTVTYSIAPVANALSYTWGVPANITLTSANGGTSITVLVGSAFTSGSITVRANSGCGNSSNRSISLNTSIPGTPGTISGTTRACNGNVFSYSVASVSNAASYNWTAPNGASVISGQGTNSVQIQYGPSFTAAGSISVTATNGCGTSAARTLSVSPNTPTQPGTITGTNRACPGDVFTYSVAVVANAQSYLWTAPTGASVISGQGTNSVQIEFNSGFIATGNVSVASVNSCGTSTVRTFSVARNSPAQPSVISGQATGICLSTQNYTVTNVNGMTYNWTSPTNTVIVSGQGTNAITLNALTGFTSGNLSVTANNACGTSTARTLALNTLPATPASITGLASGVCRGSVQTYSIANLAGATSYTWTVPSGWSIISGQGTTSIQVQVGTTNGSISARGVNACGSGSTRSLSISTTSCGRLAQQDSPFSMTVMPNPFQSNLQVMLTGMIDEMLTLEMFDIAGRVVASEQVRANQTFDFTPEVANGIYYLSVTNSNGNKETVKIIKAN